MSVKAIDPVRSGRRDAADGALRAFRVPFGPSKRLGTWYRRAPAVHDHTQVRHRVRTRCLGGASSRRPTGPRCSRRPGEKGRNLPTRGR